MANVRSLALSVWLGAGACTSSTGSSALLAGSWRTIAIPSGSGIDLSLTAVGQLVVGTGHEYTLQYLADTLRVRGHQQLDGTWTDAGQSPHSLIFYRQGQ